MRILSLLIVVFFASCIKQDSNSSQNIPDSECGCNDEDACNYDQDGCSDVNCIYPSETLENSQIYYTENGNLKTSITSIITERCSMTDDILSLYDSVYCVFYKSNGSPKSILNCEELLINNSTSIITANNDIVLNIGDTILFLEELTWDRNKKDRFFNDSDGKQRKYENVDLIYSDKEVVKQYKGSKMIYQSFRSTSLFGEDGNPFELSSVSIDSIPMYIPKN